MRTEHDILEMVGRALREKEAQRQRDAQRLAEEIEARRVFLQAARAVFTHIVVPEMERFSDVLQKARMRPTVSDTGAFYLPGTSDATLIARFALPLLREQIELPLSVSFEAVFPVGIAVYFGDAEADRTQARGEVEQVPLENVTRDLVEDRLVRVLENYLQEL